MDASSDLAKGVVGRDVELAAIGHLLAAAAAGEARTLLVAGDPGIGKTALVARACSALDGASTLLSGACLPLTSMSIPFLPIRSALRAVAELDDGLLPEVAAGEGEFVLRFDAWLDRRCAERPVVLVIDDVQWADRSTLDTLMYAMAGPMSRRLAVVVTLREGELGLGHPLQRWLADIRRLPRTSEIRLAPLDRAATAEQIEALIGAPPHQSLIDDVHARSRGNPYFTRLLVAGLRPDARTVPQSFPADLTSAVLQSWFGLSEPTRRLATVLAVGGRAMRADDLTAVVDRGTDAAAIRSHLLEAVASGTLDLLEDGTFWFHHPLNAEVLEAALGADERREWHRRFADAVEAAGGPEASVSTAVAVADHRYRAGQRSAAIDAALVAASAAGDSSGRAEQLRLLRRAAELSIGLHDASASLDAILQRIRAVAAEAGETEAELWAVEQLLASVDPATAPLVAGELHVRRVHLRFMAGRGFIDPDELRVAQRLAASDPASAEHALAMAELAHAELWAGRPDAHRRARLAMQIARGTGDPRALALALAAGSMAATYADDMREAAALGREALPHALRSRDWYAFVHAAMWHANAVESWASETYARLMRDRRLQLERCGGPHAYVAWLSAAEALSWLTSGRPAEAEARLRVALGSDPGALGDVEARLAAARLAALQGRPREAEGHLRRVEELVVDGSAFLALDFDAVRAEVRLASGDLAGAYEAALAGAVERASPPTMCEWLLPLAARALADRAQSERDAGRSPEAVLGTLDGLVERFPHAIIDAGAKTELMHRQDDALDALYAAERARAGASASEAEAWEQGVESCIDARLPWEEAYSRWRAAEALLGRSRDRRAGGDMLRSGLILARRLGARPVESELLDLARRARIPVDDPVPAAAESPAAFVDLTGREREVLAHVAAGRTYGEIARALMISEKTVSTHISHLLAKTGSANRVELARLVHRVDPDRSAGPQ